MLHVKIPKQGNRCYFPTTYLYSYNCFVDDFCTSFLNQADAVYLAQIYGSAREVDHGDVKVEDLAAKIDKNIKLSLLKMCPLS